jgi:hypothetical protein
MPARQEPLRRIEFHVHLVILRNASAWASGRAVVAGVLRQSSFSRRPQQVVGIRHRHPAKSIVQLSSNHLQLPRLHTSLIPVRNKKARCQRPSGDRTSHAGGERHRQSPIKSLQDRGDKRALLVLIACQFRPSGARFANQRAVSAQGEKQGDFHSFAAYRCLPAGKQRVEHFVDCAHRGTAATRAFSSVSRASNTNTSYEDSQQSDCCAATAAYPRDSHCSLPIQFEMPRLPIESCPLPQRRV